MINRLICKEDRKVLNPYVSGNTLSNYTRQKLIEWQEEIDESTIKVGDHTIPLGAMYRSERQKASNDIGELNNTIN